ERAERRLELHAAAEPQRVVLARRHVTGLAAGDIEDVLPRLGVAGLRHRRRDVGGNSARGGREPPRGSRGRDEHDREAKCVRDPGAHDPIPMQPQRLPTGRYCCFALYFSWQLPQFLNTAGMFALKLASSLIEASADSASWPNFLKRASKSALLSSSQIAGSAWVLSPVLLSGGKRAGPLLATSS